MKAKTWWCLVVGGVMAVTASPGMAGDTIDLRFKSHGAQGELRLHSRLGLPVSAMVPEYTIQCSTNLQDWFTVAGPVNGGVGVSDEELRVAVPLQGDRAVYRVVANVKLAEDGGGETVYGYGTEFSKELQRLGQLSLNDFVARYGLTNRYLPQISFDPTTAEFWSDFNLDPAVYNATNAVEKRLTDFRLNAEEFAVFRTNGFVVSQRLGAASFTDVFYNIFTDDLPVFFTADAALHAWHRSYMGMLEELEESYLARLVESSLRGMADQVPTLWNEAASTAMASGVQDADYFLAVARTLLTGTNNSGSLGQTAQIQATLAAISNLQPASVVMFGTNRFVDFSQFQVRGHYETSPVLQRYFRAMMWCGLIDFRFSGFEYTFPAPVENSLRELSGAAALNMLATRANRQANWAKLDEILQMFVGTSDCLTVPQLNDLLTAAGIQSPANLATASALSNLQARIMSGDVGVQSIRSGYLWSPLSHEQIKLPRTFCLLGQRFTLDGWAHSQCTFDSIMWDENGIPGLEDKVMRRVPSALDVAFSVLGNNQIVPEIAARISNTTLTPGDGRPYWRDGKPYQHNLAAVRNVVATQDSAIWTNNIYTCWLACLRELSTPTTGPEYPEAMRTRPAAMKSLNTQLASWTELRHDTVLYAKQPYTGMILCSYPQGYVEPRPTFWARMRGMALRTRDLAATMTRSGTVVFEPTYYDPWGGNPPITNSMGAIWTNRVQFLERFAETMSTLQGISEKELARQPLAPSETAFLQGLVEDLSVSYTGVRTYSGWFPGLFYLNTRAQHSYYWAGDPWDALVTDVHTDPEDPDVGDPGSILHEGVGNVHLKLIAVDCGPGDRAVYAGPVFSHYEFHCGPTTRMTDSEWKAKVTARDLPPQPDWTRCYLVPSP